MEYNFSNKDNGEKYYFVVYKIINNINGKFYIGKTHYLPDRISLHKSRYKNLLYESELYCDMRKYGLENFSLIVLEQCDINNLVEREKFWIENTRALYNGYNKSASNGGQVGFKMLESTKRKMSESRRNEKNGFYNKTHTQEVRKNINKNRGPISKETREKMSKNSKGAENSKGKKCILVLNNENIEFETLSKCYRYLINNNLFPSDYSFNSFTRWARNGKLESKGLNYKIIENI